MIGAMIGLSFKFLVELWLVYLLNAQNSSSRKSQSNPSRGGLRVVNSCADQSGDKNVVTFKFVVDGDLCIGLGCC